MNAYAAVEVIKAGIESAGSADDSAAVAKALHDGKPIETAIGTLTYGAAAISARRASTSSSGMTARSSASNKIIALR